MEARNLFRGSVLKEDLLCLVGAVFVSQMPVSFHAQRAAVLVPKLAGNGRNVNAGLNAARGKQMMQVVVGNTFCPGHVTAQPSVTLKQKSACNPNY